MGPLTASRPSSAAPGPALIDVGDLTKVYGGNGRAAVRAVDGVSFEVAAGESVALVGPSGSGKSTLLHLLGTLEQATSGSYRLGGQDVATLEDDALAALRNRSIGFVFQAFHLLPRATALDNVLIPLHYAGVRDGRARARACLERVGLGGRAGRLPGELSGGERQRVAIARAVVMGPRMVLADEPTGALDSATGASILELLESLNREGTTLIIVTHDPEVARRTSRVLHLHDGRLAAAEPRVRSLPRDRPGRRPAPAGRAC